MFITNSTSWDCGPTALANMLFWLGRIKRTPMYRNRFIDYLNSGEDGTLDRDMIKEIRELSETYHFSYKRVRDSKYLEYIKEMKNGAGVILAHVDTTYRDLDEWHYSFWFMEDGKLAGVNVFSEIVEPVVFFKDYNYFTYLCNKTTGRARSDGWIIKEYE